MVELALLIPASHSSALGITNPQREATVTKSNNQAASPNHLSRIPTGLPGDYTLAVSGFLVGASVGLIVGFRLFRFRTYFGGSVPPWLLLVLDSYVVAIHRCVGSVLDTKVFFDWAEPYRGENARTASLAISAVAAVLIAIPMLFGLLSNGTGDEEHWSSGPDACDLLWQPCPASSFSTRGAMEPDWQFGFVNHDQTPLLYWIYMAVNISRRLICICSPDPST